MKWGYAAVGVVFVLMLWGLDHLKGGLDAERAAHAATREALVGEVEKGLGWKAACEEALRAAEALRETAQACLDRAAQAETARKEREAIMGAAPARQRMETEKHEVVTDETRKRAAARLNRDF